MSAHVERETWWALPRLCLASLPTPLVPAPRFSQAIGADVWVKRDDVGAPALVGNKVRKLELLLAAAVEDGADVVVTVGAAQSNHARATAGACARLGLRCRLVLAGHPVPPRGNLLLDELLGAEIVFAGSDDWAVLAERVREEAGELEAAGARPSLLPAGGSTALGALGFAAAYEELNDQLVDLGLEPEAIYHASSSGGTHAGLLLGSALGHGPAIRGISVAKGIHDDDEAAVHDLVTGAAALLGIDVAVARDDVRLVEGFMGDAYAVPTTEATEAMALLARTEAIVCDPVYSGKALAALVHDARAGRIGGPVVFWHTGGWPALFA